MDEKMKEVWAAFLEKLTDAQKEGVKACKTAEELIALADKEGFALPDEFLKRVSEGEVSDEDAGSVAGGYLPYHLYDPRMYLAPGESYDP